MKLLFYSKTLFPCRLTSFGVRTSRRELSSRSPFRLDIKSFRNASNTYLRSFGIISGGIFLFGMGSNFFVQNEGAKTNNVSKFDDLRSDSVETIIEPVTKTHFPVTVFGYETKRSVHWLVGSSVRCMMGLCSWERARAYSYGFYISQSGLQKLKEKIAVAGIPDKQATEEILVAHILPALSDEIIVSDGKGKEYEYDYPSCMLMLVMQRDVKCDHVARGFDTTFYRRLSKEKYTNEHIKAAKDKFLDIIKQDGEWKKNTLLEVLRLPGGRLEVIINGKTRALLVSEEISWALFDAYLGKNGHFNKTAKKQVVDRTNEIMSLL